MAKKTQSARLVEVLEDGKTHQTAELAKKLGVSTDMVGSYVAELVRVYGAKIDHEKGSTNWKLTNKVDVSPAGRVNKPKAPAKKAAKGGSSTGGTKKDKRNAARRAARAAKKARKADSAAVDSSPAEIAAALRV